MTKDFEVLIPMIQEDKPVVLVSLPVGRRLAVTLEGVESIVYRRPKATSVVVECRRCGEVVSYRPQPGVALAVFLAHEDDCPVLAHLVPPERSRELEREAGLDLEGRS